MSVMYKMVSRARDPRMQGEVKEVDEAETRLRGDRRAKLSDRRR